MQVEVNGVRELRAAVQRAGGIPNATKIEMVEAEGEIVEKAIIYNAATMLVGPYYEGAVATSTKRKKARATSGGASQMITFEGTQHGNRLGEIAFVNEFGKKSQPARPFIARANKESRGAAAEAAANILNDFLNECGL